MRLFEFQSAPRFERASSLCCCRMTSSVHGSRKPLSLSAQRLGETHSLPYALVLRDRGRSHDLVVAHVACTDCLFCNALIMALFQPCFLASAGGVTEPTTRLFRLTMRVSGRRREAPLINSPGHLRDAGSRRRGRS